jgi:hypothetical protein
VTAARSSIAAGSVRADRRRVFVVAAIASLASGWLAAAWSLWYQTADFFCFWTGGRFVLSGRDPYDAAAWQAATGALYPDPRGLLLPSSCPGRFAYPYWTAVALAPFGALPLELAATLWMCLNIAATMGGAALAWRVAGGTQQGRALFLAVVFASQPFWTLLVSGQFSGILLLAVSGVAWSLARAERRGGGLALAALLLKPQVGALVIPAVIAAAAVTRRLRMLVVAAIAGAVAVAASLALAPSWPLEWLGEITTRRVAETAIRPSAWALALLVGGDPLWGVAILGALAAAVVLIARRGALRPAPLIAFAVVASLLASPYISIYDYLVLALPWALVVAAAWRTDGVERGVLLASLVGCASLLSWLLFAARQVGGSMTWSALVPMGSALLLAWSQRIDAPRA